MSTIQWSAGHACVTIQEEASRTNSWPPSIFCRVLSAAMIIQCLSSGDAEVCTAKRMTPCPARQWRLTFGHAMGHARGDLATGFEAHCRLTYFYRRVDSAYILLQQESSQARDGLIVVGSPPGRGRAARREGSHDRASIIWLLEAESRRTGASIAPAHLRCLHARLRRSLPACFSRQAWQRRFTARRDMTGQVVAVVG